jgi:hypothetical protein
LPACPEQPGRSCAQFAASKKVCASENDKSELGLPQCLADRASCLARPFVANFRIRPIAEFGSPESIAAGPPQPAVEGQRRLRVLRSPRRLYPLSGAHYHSQPFPPHQATWSAIWKTSP